MSLRFGSIVCISPTADAKARQGKYHAKTSQYMSNLKDSIQGNIELNEILDHFEPESTVISTSRNPMLVGGLPVACTLLIDDETGQDNISFGDFLAKNGISERQQNKKAAQALLYFYLEQRFQSSAFDKPDDSLFYVY